MVVDFPSENFEHKSSSTSPRSSYFFSFRNLPSEECPFPSLKYAVALDSGQEWKRNLWLYRALTFKYMLPTNMLYVSKQTWFYFNTVAISGETLKYQTQLHIYLRDINIINLELKGGQNIHLYLQISF